MIAPMAPEPCDTADLEEAVALQRLRLGANRSPCGWLDLLGQGITGLSRIRDVEIVGEWL